MAEFLNLPAVILIIGVAGSGKTNLLCKYIQLFQETTTFESGYIVSSSINDEPI